MNYSSYSFIFSLSRDSLFGFHLRCKEMKQNQKLKVDSSSEVGIAELQQKKLLIREEFSEEHLVPFGDIAIVRFPVQFIVFENGKDGISILQKKSYNVMKLRLGSEEEPSFNVLSVFNILSPTFYTFSL